MSVTPCRTLSRATPIPPPAWSDVLVTDTSAHQRSLSPPSAAGVCRYRLLSVSYCVGTAHRPPDAPSRTISRISIRTASHQGGY